jgi:flagellar M-ring protein FliF
VNILEQLRALVQSLSRRQQILIVAAAVLVGAGLWLFLRHNREKDFRPLFTGLAAEDANLVVTRLKESNMEYRLAENGGTVLVPSKKVAEARLLVAGAGLPKTGRMGFEIFDKANFGATDFAEQVNFRRALEGELERSVMAIGEVEHARVHLTFPKESVFSEMRQPAKASVLLKLRNSAQLSPRNVKAISHLMASAVEGLLPEAVTVVDMQGNLLNKSNEEETPPISPVEYRQKVERDLMGKLQGTLESVLGADHFRAGVSVEVDFSNGEQSEESFDPNRSVMVTQQRSEEVLTPNTQSGVPGTPSNLPRPYARPGSSSTGVTRRTENIAYQTSRIIRKTTLPQGNIRRISASVVVDQQVRWEGFGSKAKRILEAPSEETIQKVKDLAAGAIGFNEQRGDQIFIESLPFETTLVKAVPPPEPKQEVKPAAPGAPQPAGPNPILKFLADKGIKVHPMILIGGALAVLLLLGGAGFFILRFVRKRKRKKQLKIDQKAVLAAGEQKAAHGDQKAVTGPDGALATTSGGAAQGGVPAKHSEAVHDPEAERVERERAEREVLDSIGVPQLTTKKAEILVRHITDQAKRDPIAMAQLIRSWITEKESF